MPFSIANALPSTHACVVPRLLCALLAAVGAAGPAVASSGQAPFSTELLRGPEVDGRLRNKFKSVLTTPVADREQEQLDDAIAAWSTAVKAHSGRINAVPALAQQTRTLLALVTDNLHTCALRYRAVLDEVTQAQHLPQGLVSRHALACAAAPLTFLDPWRDRNMGVLRSIAHFNAADLAILPYLQTEGFAFSGFNPNYPQPAQGSTTVASTLVDDLRWVTWHLWPQAQKKPLLAAITVFKQQQDKAASILGTLEKVEVTQARRQSEALAEAQAAQAKELRDRARKTAENRKKKERKAARLAEAALLESERLQSAAANAPTAAMLAEQAALREQAMRASEARAREAEMAEEAADLAHKRELRDLRARLAAEATNWATQPSPSMAVAVELAPQIWGVAWDPRAEKDRRRVHDPVEEDQLDAVIQELVEFGPDLLDSSSSKELTGTGGLLFELRPCGGHSPWRLLYARSGSGTFTILACTDHDHLDAAVEVAMERQKTLGSSLI